MGVASGPYSDLSVVVLFPNIIKKHRFHESRVFDAQILILHGKDWPFIKLRIMFRIHRILVSSLHGYFKN
jgi:hypothetical protein